ncbi:MAG: hypothetical protein HY796_06115 [Elusimicrobia bacterium]|nr:hypothetical protein [Elusimicrobiota bacterium]
MKNPKNLTEAVELYLESAKQLGILKQVFEEAGFEEKEEIVGNRLNVNVKSQAQATAMKKRERYSSVECAEMRNFLPYTLNPLPSTLLYLRR